MTAHLKGAGRERPALCVVGDPRRRAGCPGGHTGAPGKLRLGHFGEAGDVSGMLLGMTERWGSLACKGWWFHVPYFDAGHYK
jgi:hypothetical protein